MSPWAESLCRWLIDFYALATILLTAVLLGGIALRQPARWMPLGWATTAGLMGLAIITAVQGFAPLEIPLFVRPTFESAVIDSSHSASSPVLEAAEIPEQSEPVAVLPVPREDAVAQPRHDGISRQTVIAGIFLVVAPIILAWQILGAFLTIRLRRMSRPAPDSIQRLMREIWRDPSQPPVVLVTGAINQALATGILNPVILLPEWFERHESESSVQAVLTHEASHISHGDLWLRAMQRWLMLVLFAHPLFWLLRGITHATQEYLADANARGEQPVDYAEILLHWFRTGAAARNKTLTATVGLWERPHLLKRRISMVLNENFPVEQSCPSPWRLTVWSLVSMSVLALSCITLHVPSESVAQETKKKPKNKVVKPKEAKPKDDKPAEPEMEAEQLKFTDEQIAKAKAKYTSADEAFGVGAAHYNSRNFAASREPFEAAVILGGDIEHRVKVYGALMASYRQLGNVEQFVTVTEYIIQHSERDAEKSLTRRSLLSFLHERGKVDPFIKRHEERLKKNPKDWLSLYLLSEVFTQLRENPARSIELLKQLAEVDGKTKKKDENDVVDVNANAKLATQYIRAKEYQKGAELYETIAPLDKNLAAWHWKEAATAWLKLKQNAKALAAAKKSAESDPEKRSELLTHFWHRHLGDVFLAVGEPKLAIPQFEKAIANTKIEGYVKDCTASLAEAKKKAGE